MKNVLITGGTGLVGKALTQMLLAKGYSVTILSRKLQNTSTPNLAFALWNVDNQAIDLAALQNADYIIHLAGAGVMDKRWSDSYKKEIADSRVNSSKLIVDSLSKANHRVRGIVSTSAIGYYGPDKGGSPFIENAPADQHFLGATCKDWEDAIAKARGLNIKTAILRVGIVLSADGGALKEFLKPLKFGVAGILGSGKQVVSWIHIEDLCRQYIFAMEHHLDDVYNAVSSSPVSNKTFNKTLAPIKNGKFFIMLPIPAFVLKILLGESSIEILKSTTVSNQKIESLKFTFKYETLEAALKNLIIKQQTIGRSLAFSDK